jgi:hypothetical protein
MICLGTTAIGGWLLETLELGGRRRRRKEQERGYFLFGYRLRFGDLRKTNYLTSQEKTEVLYTSFAGSALAVGMVYFPCFIFYLNYL